MNYGKKDAAPALLANEGTATSLLPTWQSQVKTTPANPNKATFTLPYFKNPESGAVKKPIDIISDEPSLLKPEIPVKEDETKLENILNAESKYIDTTSAFGRMAAANMQKYSRMLTKGKTASKTMRIAELSRALSSAKRSWPELKKIDEKMEASLIREAITKGTPLYDTYTKIDTLGAISTTCGMINLLKSAYDGPETENSADYNAILSDITTSLQRHEDTCLVDLEKEINKHVKRVKKPNLSIFDNLRKGELAALVEPTTSNPDVDACLSDTVFNRISDYLVSETSTFFTNFISSISEMPTSSPTQFAIVALSKSFDIRAVRTSVAINAYRSLAIRQTVDVLYSAESLILSESSQNNEDSVELAKFGVKEGMADLKKLLTYTNVLGNDSQLIKDLERFIIESFGYNNQDFATRPKIDRNVYDGTINSLRGKEKENKDDDESVSYYFLDTTPFLLSMERIGSADLTTQEKSFLKFIDVCFSALTGSRTFKADENSTTVEKFKSEFVNVLTKIFSSEAVIAFNVFLQLDAMLCSYGEWNLQKIDYPVNIGESGKDATDTGERHIISFNDRSNDISTIVGSARKPIKKIVEAFLEGVVEYSKTSAENGNTLSSVDKNSQPEKYVVNKGLVTLYNTMSNDIMSALMNAFDNNVGVIRNAYHIFKTSTDTLKKPNDDNERIASYRAAFSELKTKMRESLQNRSKTNVKASKLAKTIISWSVLEGVTSASVSALSKQALEYWNAPSPLTEKPVAEQGEQSKGAKTISSTQTNIMTYYTQIFAKKPTMEDVANGVRNIFYDTFQDYTRRSLEYPISILPDNNNVIKTIIMSDTFFNEAKPSEVKGDLKVNFVAFLKQKWDIDVQILLESEFEKIDNSKYSTFDDVYNSYAQTNEFGDPTSYDITIGFINDAAEYVADTATQVTEGAKNLVNNLVNLSTTNNTSTINNQPPAVENNQFMETLYNISVAYTELHPEIKPITDKQREILAETGVTKDYFMAMLTNIQQIMATVNLTIEGEALRVWASSVFGTLRHVLTDKKTLIGLTAGVTAVSMNAFGITTFAATMVDYTSLQTCLATAAFVCGSSLATLGTRYVTTWVHDWINTDATTTTTTTGTSPVNQPAKSTLQPSMYPEDIRFRETNHALKHLIASFVSEPDESGRGSTATIPNLSEKARQELQHVVQSGFSISTWAPRIVNGILSVVPPLFTLFQLISVALDTKIAGLGALTAIIFANDFSPANRLNGFAKLPHSFLMLLAASSGLYAGSYPWCAGISAVVTLGYVGVGCYNIYLSENVGSNATPAFAPSTVWPPLCVAITKRMFTEFSVPGIGSRLKQITSSKSRIIPAIYLLSESFSKSAGMSQWEGLVTAAFLALADNTEYLDDLRNFANIMYKTKREDSFHPNDTKGIANASVFNPSFSKLLQGTWATLNLILNMVTKSKALKICFVMLKTMAVDSQILKDHVIRFEQLWKWADMTEIYNNSFWFAIMVACIAGTGILVSTLAPKWVTDYFDVGNVSKVKDALVKEESIKVAKKMQEEVEFYYRYGLNRQATY